MLNIIRTLYRCLSFVSLCINIIYVLTYKVNSVFVQLCLPFMYTPELLGKFVIK